VSNHLTSPIPHLTNEVSTNDENSAEPENVRRRGCNGIDIVIRERQLGN